MQISRREARKEERREAIIAAARASFLENGYAATSMNSIAAAIGGSKGTLWAYFASKEELFAAVLDAEIARFQGEILAQLNLDEEVDVALRRFGRKWLGRILSQDALHLQRTMAAESERFPEMARLFYEQAPGRVEQRLTAYLQDATADGRLQACDPRLAARQLMHLCLANRYLRCVWNIEAVPDQAAVDADVDAAVDTFMRAFGPASSSV